MHELAITESIVSAVCERFGETRVTRVILEIGRLTAVVPDSVRFCFDVCAKDTPLEGAALEIIEVPGAAHCRTCATDFALEQPIPLCACGSADVDVQRGQELRIRAVEVQ